MDGAKKRKRIHRATISEHKRVLAFLGDVDRLLRAGLSSDANVYRDQSELAAHSSELDRALRRLGKMTTLIVNTGSRTYEEIIEDK